VTAPAVPKADSKIALVTVLYDCERYLTKFFECMALQTDRDFCVIVVDNASRDASLTRARELSAALGVTCEFITNPANVGIAVGNNQGIERACELGLQHVVLINNDIGCDPDLISQIRDRAIARGHRAWTCLAWYGDSETRWYGGGHLSFWRARGMHLDDAHSADILDPVPVSYAPTCLMYVHTSVFDDVGLMDPQYFVYYDDTDFCRRLLDAGIQIVYDPTVAFRHYVGGSSGGDLSDFFLQISTRNKFIYIRKFYRQPTRTAVMTVAVGSKLAQMLSKQRRRPTWLGLQEAFCTARSSR
jgi:GT2 family glycosyltransferase